MPEARRRHRAIRLRRPVRERRRSTRSKRPSPAAARGSWPNSDLSHRKGNPNDPDLPALNIVQNVAHAAIIPDHVRRARGFRLDGRHEADRAVRLRVQHRSPRLAAARDSSRRACSCAAARSSPTRVARIGSNVTPVHFQRLDGTGGASSYSQAIASWVGAEIEVSGEQHRDRRREVQRRHRPVDDAVARRERQRRGGGPQSSAVRAAGVAVQRHARSRQALRDVLRRCADAAGAGGAPRAESRAPRPDAPEYRRGRLAATSIRRTALWSDLLNAIRLNIGRTVVRSGSLSAHSIPDSSTNGSPRSRGEPFLSRRMP